MGRVCCGSRCVVALELRTNRKVRLWYDELGGSPPYDIGPDSLFIAYQAAAEAACHLALNWPRPAFILDLYNEFRWLINGDTAKPTSTPLLRALLEYGIASVSKEEKNLKRKLVLRGGPWSWEERLEILDYCEGDVTTTAQLFREMTRYD